MLEIKPANENDISKVQELANQIWWSVYDSILSQAQIQYMLNTLYSKEALQIILNDKTQNLILLYENSVEQGFAAYGKKAKSELVYNVHKLYVLPSQHKRGFGRLLIEEIKMKLLHINVHALELNVNRNNPAKFFYEKLGFKIIREEDIPIGPFWMNDYVMRLEF